MGGMHSFIKVDIFLVYIHFFVSLAKILYYQHKESRKTYCKRNTDAINPRLNTMTTTGSLHNQHCTKNRGPSSADRENIHFQSSSNIISVQFQHCPAASTDTSRSSSCWTRICSSILLLSSSTTAISI